MLSISHTILESLRDIRLIDPHSHINPHQPASTTLADILGYHYYTELVHSAGTPKAQIESAGLAPRELVKRLVGGLHHLSNTAQHSWLIDICQRFFDFEGDVIDESNWESLYDAAEAKMGLADWADVVLEKSNVEAVFLTNDFDDKLAGFDTSKYIPCLRTDDLVFHLSKIEVQGRLATCSGIETAGSLNSLRDSLEQRFEHFVAHGARACAISLPPDFTPTPVSDGRATTALDAILRQGPAADGSHKAAMAKRVFWTIVELCDQYKLPMDLMIGVNRGVYEEGVYQGRDLYDSRVSLIQYRELFNAFPQVKFPISVLASVTNQELVSYAWIFPNVITNGHWWYSNTPSFIRRDAEARLEAVPRNKQIGYYSDAYKLEFIAPKFDMYRRILANILTDDFVIARGWSEEKAIELGGQILRGNVDTIFPNRSTHEDRDNQSQSPLMASAAPLMAPPMALATETTEAEPEPEWSHETIVEWSPESEEPTAPEQSAESSAEASDPHATIGLPPLGLGEFSLEDDSPPSDIRFFRGDDEMNEVADEDADFSLLDDAVSTDDPAGSSGLHADPITGELTWPADSASLSDDSLDETYLLADEPAEADFSETLNLETAPEIESFEEPDFEGLELEPLGEDELEMEGSDQDVISFDPHQTADFDPEQSKND